MPLKLKHLRHPLRTANVAIAIVTAHLSARKFIYHSERHFRGDARYELQSVTDGFVSRIDERIDDTALLERICTAYTRAVESQRSAPDTYNASSWWEEVRRGNLSPVMQALSTHNIAALRTMYRNFFRDPCSVGLVGRPLNLAKAYSGGKLRDVHRRFLLSDTLYRVDHWKTQMGDGFTLHDLAGPDVGNPLGVVLDGVLVSSGAEYQHYCAQQICRLSGSEKITVAEIGGGFGGMAYYLLRDRPGVTYLDFDMPESIALTSYYLLKAFPKLNFLLYGEAELREATEAADVILMPTFELTKMPEKSVDAVFSSHAMSDISHAAIEAYLSDITRMTKKYFLYIGHAHGGKSLFDLLNVSKSPLHLKEDHVSEWNCHRVASASEIECLYCVGKVDEEQWARAVS
jgi:putative sugar O-methyltransferase